MSPRQRVLRKQLPGDPLASQYNKTIRQSSAEQLSPNGTDEKDRTSTTMRRLLVYTSVVGGVVLFLACTHLYLFFSPQLLWHQEPHFEPHRPLNLGRRIKLNSTASSVPDFHLPLRTSGSKILDSRDAVVKLTSINWYGASDVIYIPSGLDTRHRDEIALLIRRMGFNSVRLPYADEMVRKNPFIPDDELSANPDLVGQRALDVFFAVVNSLTDAGLMVIPNDHITQAAWCCGTNLSDLCDGGWSNDWLEPFCRVRQTEEDWIQNWETVMRPLANNPLVVGADLRNEVRGIWGTMPWDTWASAAEKASERLLSINRNWLMFIEGISSANDLSGVRKRPVKLSVPDRVVYSSHIYSWSGWGQLWTYGKRPFESFAGAMIDNWAYLISDEIAPVWVGELGVSDMPNEEDLNYWDHLAAYLRNTDTSWGYWALNPRKPGSNDWESYGLVDDDWETVRWDYRMDDMVTLGLTPHHKSNPVPPENGQIPIQAQN
ncbi:hypothetical protein AJ80_01928 [Polytolypa hystricis UAMH7299]|uniref:Glycoside hydrolase family 5 domain-containing protein n=1 Tax=Polytolypa hystricis (strain UAMH7299) TaxID=1447883 RepID=A0A2B7YZ59_POLH7|nr:hypothetical protein AJ80_01928 [Polytolypa hystricis UAMH7299]